MPEENYRECVNSIMELDQRVMNNEGLEANLAQSPADSTEKIIYGLLLGFVIGISTCSLAKACQ